MIDPEKIQDTKESLLGLANLLHPKDRGLVVYAVIRSIQSDWDKLSGADKDAFIGQTRWMLNELDK